MRTCCTSCEWLGPPGKLRLSSPLAQRMRGSCDANEICRSARPHDEGAEERAEDCSGVVPAHAALQRPCQTECMERSKPAGGNATLSSSRMAVA
jgi:hypothetical protein